MTPAPPPKSLAPAVPPAAPFAPHPRLAAAPPGAAPFALIYIRRGEAASKCTIRPLRGTPGLAFHAWPPRPGTLPPPDSVVLAPDAPPLAPSDASRPLVLLDASWRHAAKMLNLLRRLSSAPLALRSLPSAWQTAYPRRSKTHDDPSTGLATVEALYAALATLRSPFLSPALLSHYPFAPAFLSLNAPLIPPPIPPESPSALPSGLP